jgi:hypothetical protein
METEQNNILYSKNLDYSSSKKISQNSYYKHTKILQQNGSEAVAITANASVQATFDIPSTVYNLCRSKLRFNLSMPALALNRNVAILDVPPIQRITLQTRGGKYLCDIQNAQHFWKMTTNLQTRMDEFESYNSAGAGDTVALARLNGVCLFHNPTQALNSQAIADANAFNGVKLDNGGVQANPVGRKQYSSQIQVIGSTINTANAIDCEILLGKIPFSFFACDKDFYSTEALQLVLEFAPWTSFSYGLTAAPAYNPLAAPTMGGLQLLLAVEQNQAVASALMARVMSQGLNMVIPVPYMYRYGLGANTSVSVQQKINRGHGQRLLRIISAPSLTADTLNTRCNFYNNNAEKHTSFYTTIDSLRQEPEDLDVASKRDYAYIKNKLENTPVFNHVEFYSQCPAYVNDFSSSLSLPESKWYDQTINGLPLDAEITWGKIVTKTVTDTTENVAIIAQKNLISSAAGVDLI